MKTFIHLTKEECLEVYPEVERNAEMLYDSARVLGEHGNYGNAIGLLVLGAEEYIKCFLLFLEGYGFDLFKMKEIQGIFSKQRARHTVIRDFYSIWMVLKHILSIKTQPEGKDISHHLLNAMISLIPARNSYNWWAKADHLKQKGLYVDYLNRLISPSNFTKNDYESALAKTQPIPQAIQDFIQRITAMNKRNLDELLQLFEESNLPNLIAESMKRKVTKKIAI